MKLVGGARDYFTSTTNHADVSASGRCLAFVKTATCANVKFACPSELGNRSTDRAVPFKVVPIINLVARL